MLWFDTTGVRTHDLPHSLLANHYSTIAICSGLSWLDEPTGTKGKGYVLNITELALNNQHSLSPEQIACYASALSEK
jgi:hypothetical protein